MISDYKKVLVTGGAGCIGMAICKELSKRGIHVNLFDLPEQIIQVKNYIQSKTTICYGSILDKSSLREAIVDCDAVIHLAAYLGVHRTETNKLRCLEINIDGTKNVIECAVQHRVKKFVFASSSEVYGEPLENPVNEEAILQGKSVYAISKMAGEEILKAYSQRYPAMSYTILRYFNTYGPFQKAQFVIPKFISSVINGSPPVIYGDGQQKRSYCFSSDTAKGTVEALISDKSNNDIYNIGNSHILITLNDLAKLIINASGHLKDLVPRYEAEFKNADRSRAREVFSRHCNISKAKEILNYNPIVSLEDGIKEIIDSGLIMTKWATTDLDYTIDE